MIATDLFLSLFESLTIDSIALLLCKVTLVLGLVFLVRRLFVNQSASLRHTILALSLLALPLVAVSHFNAPLWAVPEFGLETQLSAVPAAGNAETPSVGSPSLPVEDLEVDETGWVSTPLGPETHDSSVAAGISCDAQESTWSANNPFVDPAPLRTNPIEVEESFTLRKCQAEPVVADEKVQELSAVQPVAAGNWRLWTSLLSGIWFIVCVLLLTRLLIAWRIVARIAGRARPVDEMLVASCGPRVRELLAEIRGRGISVLISDRENLMPCGIGIFRKAILLPSSCVQWSSSQWRSVLLHEFAHFQRGDCRTNLIARVQQAALWFHPLAWTLVRHLRLESEIACDDRVLQSGVSRLEYADLLLQFARNGRGIQSAAVATVTMSDPGPLESRMKSVLSDRSRRNDRGKWQMAAATVLVAAITMCVATAGFALQSEDNPLPIRGNQNPLLAVSRDASDEGPAETDIRDYERSALLPADLLPADLLPAEEETALSNTVAPRFVFDLAEGEPVTARGDFELTLRTEFGHATFESGSILSVHRIGRSSPVYQVKSLAGSTLTGTMVGEELFVVSGGSGNGETLAGMIEVTNEENNGGRSLKWGEDILHISAVRPAPLEAATITSGHALNGVSYHLRAPDRFNPARTYPGIVILHGSNSNGESYIRKIVTLWPGIAENYILIGINGEQLAREFDADNPKYNYTYINFAGNSDKFRGFPGTDRESPALVSEVITELRGQLPVDRLFVGGHSQGAFLTISLVMNYPELVDGAFPMAGGMLIQCEPEGYLEETIRQRQRQTPVVLVHAKDDAVVDFSLTETAWRSYMDGAFPMLRLIAPEEGGHSFSNLPFDEAIAWLEKMTENSKPRLLELALEMAIEGHKRDAVALLNSYDNGVWDPELNPEETRAVAETVRKVIDEAVRSEAFRFEGLIRENLDSDWIDEFLEFRSEYEFASSARSVMAVFAELRSHHDEAAVDIFEEAIGDYRLQRYDDAEQSLLRIVNEFYASKRYPLARILLGEIDQRRR